MSQVFEVQCKHCAGIFDLTEDPSVINWSCPCQTKEGSSVFKKYWIACGVNPRHRYYANRAEDCKFCVDEKENKKALITLEHKGLRIDGEVIKPTFEKVDQSLLTSIGIEQREKLFTQIKEDEKSKIDREELIIKLLQEINQKLTSQEPRELDDK